MRSSQRLQEIREARLCKRGFTLIELMITVVIVGILATIGGISAQKHMKAAKNTEAIAMVRSIASAQEAYRGENLVYLDVSDGDLTDYYPTAAPGLVEYHFWGHPGEANWRQLSVVAPAKVLFGFSTIAGQPADTAPVFSFAGAPAWPGNLTEPWYVVEAIGDVDGNGIRNFIALTSLSRVIYQENIGE